MSAIRFGSVASGIEAASVAFAPLGWQPAWLSEINPFACALLAHHYPKTANLGDMTKLPARILSHEVEAPQVFCGGTPCQSLSIAGSRQSLSDKRGILALTFVDIANAIDTARSRRGLSPAVILWENVFGVLNTKDNAFGYFLAGLAGNDGPLQPPGKKWTNAGAVYGPQRAVAWRVLDAQYFGLAQRRRRVFVVASDRNGADPAEILFESEGVRRDSPPRRETRQVAPTLPCRGTAGNELTDALAFDCKASGLAGFGVGDIAGTMRAKGGGHLAVRRLTPRECERLMGFPDDYTLIPHHGNADDPRYTALGNSWAVPVVRWIGERIAKEVSRHAAQSAFYGRRAKQ